MKNESKLFGASCSENVERTEIYGHYDPLLELWVNDRGEPLATEYENTVEFTTDLTRRYVFTAWSEIRPPIVYDGETDTEDDSQDDSFAWIDMTC